MKPETDMRMKKKGVTIELRIKQFRESNGLTQQELADKINVDRTTLSQYETGKRVPDIYVLWDIADVLDLSLDDLVKGELDERRDY